MRSAVNSGYALGFKTILDANILTMLTAVVLFLFATASPRASPFTLILGVIVSMLTAVLFTRAMLGVLAGFAFFNQPSLMGVKAGQIDIETAVMGDTRAAASRRRRRAASEPGDSGRRRRPLSRATAGGVRATTGIRAAAPYVHLPQARRSGGSPVNFFRRIYQFDYMGHKYWWFTLSAVIIAVGLISLFVKGGGNPVDGLNYGLEFQEGTRVTVAFEQSPSLGRRAPGRHRGGLPRRADPADRQRRRLRPIRLPDPDCRC